MAATIPTNGIGLDAGLDVTGGDITFKTADKGVNLGVTSGAASNLLHDYEEGTWTASLQGNLGGSGTGYDNATMQYTKIGRTVYITGTLDMNDLGSLGGDYLKVAGLPFTPDASNSNNYQPINTLHFNVQGDVTGGAFTWAVYAANTFAYVFESHNTGASQATKASDYEDGTICGISGAYITAA